MREICATYQDVYNYLQIWTFVPARSEIYTHAETEVC